MTDLGDMVVRFGADTSGLTGGIGQAGQALGGLSSMASAALGPVGGLLVSAAGAAIGVGVASVKMAGDFQEGMTQLVTGAGESQKNIGMVSDGILKMAVATGTSTKDLSAGMYMIESAGYHGAAGLAVLQAAAEGAKVGNASLADVANGVTTAMTDYAKTNLTAAQATNFLVSVVANGKTHMGDLARSMSTILPTAAAVGVSITDVGGAMATMTGEGTGAAQASTYLRQLLMALASPAKAGATALKSIGLTTQEVSTDMKKSLPDTLQLIMKHLAETYTVGSPQYMAALKNIAGGSKQMQGMLELTGDHLKTFGANVGLVAGSMNQGGNAIAGWNQVQDDFNFKISQAKEVVETLMIKIGTALLPVLTNLMNVVLPLITSFSDWVTSGSGLGAMFGQLSGAVSGFFSGLSGGGKSSPFAGLMADAKQMGSVIMADVKPAFAEISSIVGGVFADHLKTAQGIGKSLTTWFSAELLPAIHSAMPGFQSLASVMIGTVVPGLVKLWAIGQKVVDEVMPPLISVFEAIIPVAIKFEGIIAGGVAASLKFLMPYIIQAASALGQFAGDIATRIAPIIVNFFHNISTSLDTFMAVWKVVWPLLAPVLMGLWNEIVGIVKIAWAIVSGIIKVGLDLLSGNWGQAWSDIKDMFSGIWSGIVQFFQGGVQMLLGLVTGLCSGIVQLFTGLWNDLVGHSIVPDMVNGIITWFSSLVAKATGWITSLVSTILGDITGFARTALSLISGWVTMTLGFYNQLGTQAGQAIQHMVSTITGILNNFISGAASFGQKLIQGIIGGITGMMGNLGNTMHNVVGFIGSFLPHSPAEQGELSHLNEYGPSFVKGFADGITNSIPMLQTSLDSLMKPVAVTMTTAAAPTQSSTGTFASPSASHGKQQAAPTIENHVHIHIDGQELTGIIAPQVMSEMVYRARSSSSVGRTA